MNTYAAKLATEDKAGLMSPDGSDLLDNIGRRVQVQQSLVDPHLETIPSVGTLTSRRLPGGDVQHLGGQAHRALHLQMLVLCSANEVSANYSIKEDCDNLSHQVNSSQSLRAKLKRSMAVLIRPKTTQ